MIHLHLSFEHEQFCQHSNCMMTFSMSLMKQLKPLEQIKLNAFISLMPKIISFEKFTVFVGEYCCSRNFSFFLSFFKRKFIEKSLLSCVRFSLTYHFRKIAYFDTDSPKTIAIKLNRYWNSTHLIKEILQLNFACSCILRSTLACIRNK